MKTKKKEKQFNDDNKPPAEQVQADHEAFLQVFERPTQIYRFLRTRHLVHPCFMHRNLNYMKGRCVRKTNTRKNFNFADFIEAASSRQQEAVKGGSVTLDIMGICDQNSAGKWNSADLEVLLVRVCNLRKKVNGLKRPSGDDMEVVVGKAQVPVSCHNDLGESVVTMNIDAAHFSANQSVHAIKLKVRAKSTAKSTTQENNTAAAPSSSTDPPLSSASTSLPAKRRRGSRVPDDAGAVSHSPVPTLAEEPSPEEQGTEYGGELGVVDHQGARQMSDGDYALVLSDLVRQQSAAIVTPAGRGTWQTVNPAHAPKNIDQSALFEECPILKFKVKWQSPKSNGVSKDTASLNHTTESTTTTTTTKVPPSSPSRRHRVFYQFLYSPSNNNNNNGPTNGTTAIMSASVACTRQQTEARSDLTCPWCVLACPSLYALAKHLRTCHPRFQFTYSDHPKGARIDVAINEHYDGSYSGNPHDLYSYTGLAYCRTKPVQRMSVTQILTWRAPKPSFEMSEFNEPECEETVRPMVAGHDRLYFHTITCTVQYPSEIDYDSDSELHPQWIRQKTQNLIDDFTDVNEGEKEIMKMWNLHVMQHNFIGDCQLPAACALFVAEYGERVLSANLSRNLLLHLVNLYDHGLIKPELIHRTMMQLYRLGHRLRAGGDAAAKPKDKGASPGDNGKGADDHVKEEGGSGDAKVTPQVQA